MRTSPKRIVCLTEETVETLYLLGEDQRIVGVSGYAVRPLQVRREKPRVSAFTSANIPKILELNPDLVLAFSDLQAEIVANLIREGLEVHAFNHRDIKGILKMIYTIGALVDAEKKAEELVAFLVERIEHVKRDVCNLPKQRVYFEEWDDPMISGIGWVSELIEIAGGEDGFKALGFKKAAKDRVVSSCDVIDASPEVILASWCGKKVRPERISSRSYWSEIPAVSKNRIYEIKSSIILQPGPAAITEGLDGILKALYPPDMRHAC